MCADFDYKLLYPYHYLYPFSDEMREHTWSRLHIGVSSVTVDQCGDNLNEAVDNDGNKYENGCGLIQSRHYTLQQYSSDGQFTAEENNWFYSVLRDTPLKISPKFFQLAWKYVFLENFYNKDYLDWCRH